VAKTQGQEQVFESAPPLADGRASISIDLVIQGILRGDEHSFNLFYDRYYDRLYRYLIVIAPLDEELVRETMQEAMIRILRYIKPFENESIFWGWLTRVAKSALFDLIRRRKSSAKLDRLITDNKVIPLYPDETDSDEKLLEALQKVKDKLNEEERALIDAYYIQGEKQTDLAVIYGTTAKAIESRLARLRKKMKTMILQDLDNEQ